MKHFINKQSLRQIKLIALLVVCLFPISSNAQRDTFALYKMGEVGRVDGLSYGTCYSLLLFTDSTFTYSAHVGMQISTSYGVVASGTWTKKDDLFTFTDSSKQQGEIVYNTCTTDPGQKNLRLRFNFGESLMCFDLPPVIIYNQGSVRFAELIPEELPRGEKASKLEKYVPSFSAFVKLDLNSCDSLKIFGTTVIPGEPTCNFFGFSCRPPFRLNLIQIGDDLQVIENIKDSNYIFEKVR